MNLKPGLHATFLVPKITTPLTTPCFQVLRLKILESTRTSLSLTPDHQNLRFCLQNKCKVQPLLPSPTTITPGRATKLSSPMLAESPRCVLPLSHLPQCTAAQQWEGSFQSKNPYFKAKGKITSLLHSDPQKKHKVLPVAHGAWWGLHHTHRCHSDSSPLFSPTAPLFLLKHVSHPRGPVWSVPVGTHLASSLSPSNSTFSVRSPWPPWSPTLSSHP